MEKAANTLTFITADDHSIVTKSLAFILKDLYANAVIYEVHNLADVVKKASKEHIDLILLDVSFPDGDSHTIIGTLKNFLPNVMILIFSGQDEELYAPNYLKLGANGYVHKLSNEDQIKTAITAVMTKGKYFSEKLQEKIAHNYLSNKPENPFEQLSTRELEITRLMIEGLGNLEICTILNLQKSTVSTYKNRIFEKLAVNNLADLIKLYGLHNPY